MGLSLDDSPPTFRVASIFANNLGAKVSVLVKSNLKLAMVILVKIHLNPGEPELDAAICAAESGVAFPGSIVRAKPGEHSSCSGAHSPSLRQHAPFRGSPMRDENASL